MQFLRNEVGFTVVRITGPNHNVLRLAFGAAVSEPVVSNLKPSSGEGRLSTCKVVNAVMAGVADANTHFDAEYEVVEIAFLASDSPPEDVYALLAFRIIERLEINGEFILQRD